jgi:hypothetical protein
MLLLPLAGCQLLLTVLLLPSACMLQRLLLLLHTCYHI